MKNKLILIATLFATFNANALELKEGLDTVFKENPSLQNAKKNLGLKQESINQSRSNFMPDISASYSLTHNHYNYENTTSNDLGPSSGGITLSQDLFKGGSNIAGFKQAKLNYQAELNNFKSTQQTIFENAANVYLTVLTAQEVLELNKRQVSTSTEEMNRLNQRFKLGDITIPELKEFEARLSGYIADKEEAYGNLLAAKANFLSTFGFPAEDLKWPNLKNIEPKTLEEAIAASEQNNPDIITYRLNTEALAENIKSARADFMPSVSANASWTSNSNTGTTNSDVTSVGLTASIPLFKGGENVSKYKEAKIKFNQAEDSLQQKVRDVKASTDIAFNDVFVQTARVKALDVRKGSFETTTDAIEKQEKAGEASIIDVLDARDDEFSAHVDLKLAKQKLVLAKLKMLSLLGKFTKDNLNNIFE